MESITECILASLKKIEEEVAAVHSSQRRFEKELLELGEKIAPAAGDGRVPEMMPTNSSLVSGMSNPFLEGNDQQSQTPENFGLPRRLDLKGIQDIVANTNCVFSPNSTFRGLWDILSLFCLTLDMVIIPFQLSFGSNDLYPHSPVPAGIRSAFTLVGNILLIFWSVDMAFSCNTGYITKNGEREMRRRRLLWRYLRGWFALDAIVVCPDWYFLLTGSEANGPQRSVRMLKASRFLRGLRLLKLAKAKEMWNDFIDRFHSETIELTLGTIKHVFVLVICCHALACVWYLLGAIQGDAGWLGAGGEAGDSEYTSGSLLYRYYTSFHWAMCQFTPSSIEVRPRTAMERGFNCLVTLIGLCFFSSFLCSLTGTVTKLRLITLDRDRELRLVRRFLQQRPVSRQLKIRIVKCIEQELDSHSKRLFEDDVPGLRYLSNSLRLELKYEELSQTFVNYPLLHIWDSIDNQAVRMLCALAATQTLRSEDLLFTPGMRAEAMYFSLSGHLVYTPAITKPQKDDGRRRTVDMNTLVSSVIGTGRYFSEPALWSCWLHMGYMAAMDTTIEVLPLTSEMVKQVSIRHPRIGSLNSEYRHAFNAFLDEQGQSELVTDLDHGVELNDVIMHIEDESVRDLLRHRDSVLLQAPVFRGFFQRSSSRMASHEKESAEQHQQVCDSGSEHLSTVSETGSEMAI